MTLYEVRDILMTEIEGKEDDRGGTAEVRAGFNASVCCFPNYSHLNIIVCPRVVVFFAFIIKFERLTRVNTSP